MHKYFILNRKREYFVEPLLPLSLVLGISGGALSAIVTLGRKFEAIDQKQQAHVALMENRMDSIELRLAQKYVDKTDLQNILERLDARIDRMDYKLDQILIGYNKTAPPQM
tara:strand:- start:516 stop:848 length:333 start_codon:yes stop_codon:yes gene_type:complete